MSARYRAESHTSHRTRPALEGLFGRTERARSLHAFVKLTRCRFLRSSGAGRCDCWHHCGVDGLDGSRGLDGTGDRNAHEQAEPPSLPPRTWGGPGATASDAALFTPGRVAAISLRESPATLRTAPLLRRPGWS